MELTYTKNGDYYIPNLTVPEQPDAPLGKYGKMRLQYLKEHDKGLYTELTMDCTLKQHLLEVQETARNRMELMMKQMAKEQGITEDMKMTDQMKWVGMMNNIHDAAEEIILNELIYN